jgi:hypothetical protein
MRVDRRIGALLLLIGGVMDLARLITFSGFAPVTLPEPASIAVNDRRPTQRQRLLHPDSDRLLPGRFLEVEAL